VATGLEAAHRNALKIACFRCGYLSSFCGRWTTGGATRPTSHLVLKQSGALLNWRPKERRSPTLNGELAKAAACIACRADAKELNPAGLSIPASTQLDHPLDPTTRLSEIRVLWSRLPNCGVPRSLPGGQRRRSLYLEEQLARLPHQFSNVPAFRNSLASIAAMLKRVLVASRGP